MTYLEEPMGLMGLSLWEPSVNRGRSQSPLHVQGHGCCLCVSKITCFLRRDLQSAQDTIKSHPSYKSQESMGMKSSGRAATDSRATGESFVLKEDDCCETLLPEM